MTTADRISNVANRQVMILASYDSIGYDSRAYLADNSLNTWLIVKKLVGENS